MRSREAQRACKAARIGIVGFLFIAAYSVAGSLQILVWNPLAAVPGATLDEINARMERANDSLAAPMVIAWASIGTLLAAGVLIGARAQRLSAEGAQVLNLLITVLAAPSHWFVSIPAGMGIADVFATTGGDHSPWGMVLYGVSAAALAVLVIHLVHRPDRSVRVP
jgi:hypothetical protein